MSEEPKVDRNIADELGKLGQQVANAAKAVWESEERRKLQAELTRGVEKFSQEPEHDAGQSRRERRSEGRCAPRPRRWSRKCVRRM